MSCRRLRRELLDAVRFGGGLLRSGPHLDHLERCRTCRQEVSFDRELVHAVRRSLRARVDGADPSPDAWSAVIREIGVPERGVLAWFRARSAPLLRSLRTATAVSALALAVVITNGTQTTITEPDPTPANPRSSLGDWFEQQPILARGSIPTGNRPHVYVAPPPSDPEQLLVEMALRVSPIRVAEPVSEESDDDAASSELLFDIIAGGATPLDGTDADEAEAADVASRVRGSPGGEPR
jgi:hypothetical protein